MTIHFAVLAGALLLALACGQGDRKDPGEQTESTPAPAGAPSGAIPPGQLRIDVSDGRVTVQCNGAPRGLVLEKLARAARFELTGELDAEPLTLDLQNLALESSIAALLADLPFRAQWRYDATSDRHELAKLEVGELAGAALDDAALAKPKQRSDLGETLRNRIREKREKAVLTEEQKAELAARREERVRSEADMLEQLRSSNPEMRMEAVEGIDPDGAALPILLDVLKNDPDPRVREKAAEQGGEAEGFLACSALIEALGDREPAVVLQALESVEFSCDDTVGPIVAQRCAAATDPAVQARCAEAVDFLQ